MPSPLVLVAIGGVTLLSVLIFQVLLGRRIIHFKGPLHAKVHKWTGYAMLAIAVGHGAYAIYTILPLVS